MAKSLENRITEDSIYKMFSYANLYLCLHQIDTIYSSLRFQEFKSFVDYLCSCSNDDLERIAETFKTVLDCVLQSLHYVVRTTSHSV